MKKTLHIFHYVPRSSIAHRADPKIKLIILILFAILLFFVSQVVHLAIFACLLLLACVVAKIDPITLLKSIWVVLLVFIFISALNMLVVQSGEVLFSLGGIRITDEGCARALLYGGRMVLLLLAGALMLACTSPMQLTNGLGELFAPLQKLGVPISQLAFILALAIRYIPILYDETTSIVTAQKCRGASIGQGSLIERSRAIRTLIIPVIMASIRHAENLSLALLSKNYIAGAKRTKWSYEGFLERRKNMRALPR